MLPCEFSSPRRASYVLLYHFARMSLRRPRCSPFYYNNCPEPKSKSKVNHCDGMNDDLRCALSGSFFGGFPSLESKAVSFSPTPRFSPGHLACTENQQKQAKTIILHVILSCPFFGYCFPHFSFLTKLPLLSTARSISYGEKGREGGEGRERGEEVVSHSELPFALAPKDRTINMT